MEIDELEVVTEPGEILLHPILSDKKEKTQEFRRRSSAFNFKTAHPADVEGLQTTGWIVQKAGKRKTRLKKEKTLDQRLEDRIWCLLHGMGYAQLNGDKFNVRFQRSDESILAVLTLVRGHF